MPMSMDPPLSVCPSTWPSPFHVPLCDFTVKLSARRYPRARLPVVRGYELPSLRFYFNTVLNPSIPQSRIGHPRAARGPARRAPRGRGTAQGRFGAATPRGAQIALRFDAISPTRHGRGGPGRAGTVTGEHRGRGCDSPLPTHLRVEQLFRS